MAQPQAYLVLPAGVDPVGVVVRDAGADRLEAVVRPDGLGRDGVGGDGAGVLQGLVAPSLQAGLTVRVAGDHRAAGQHAPRVAVEVARPAGAVGDLRRLLLTQFSARCQLSRCRAWCSAKSW